MSKKRILMVSCGGLGNGGVQSIMMGIVRNLTSELHFDMLLFTSEKRHYDDEFKNLGGKIYRIPHYEGKNRLISKFDNALRDIYIYKKVKRLLKSVEPYDVIHCHKEYESAPVLKAAAECGIPIRIFHTHVFHSSSGFIKNTIDNIRKRLIEKYATHWIGCSEHSINSLGFKNVSPKVMPNFYNELKYHLVDASIGDTENKLVISQVGAYFNIKNQLFSMHIVEILRKKGYNVKLNLIGFDMDDNYSSMMKSYIIKNNLENTISMIKGDKDFTSYLRQSNLFLLPSLSEGFPIALIEAQSIGLKCFASTNVTEETNCGGVDYLTLENGAEYWASAIEEWYKKSRGVKSLYDTTKYQTCTVMKMYKNLYNSLR